MFCSSSPTLLHTPPTQDDASAASYRLQLCTDRGQYPLNIALPPEELIRGDMISQDEAEKVCMYVCLYVVTVGGSPEGG